MASAVSVFHLITAADTQSFRCVLELQFSPLGHSCIDVKDFEKREEFLSIFQFTFAASDSYPRPEVL